MIERSTPPAQAKLALVQEVKAQAGILGGAAGLMWGLEIVDTILGGMLDGFGIHPRSFIGLIGILFAPFLHAGFAHLIANTVPFLVLGFIIMLRRKRDFFYVATASALVGGIGTWLTGATNSVHLGASVVVFGFLGYLLSRGIFERKFWSILGSVVVFFLYGGAIFGVLPGQAGISWQGHLFGFIGGVLSARLLSQRGEAVQAREITRRRLAR